MSESTHSMDSNRAVWFGVTFVGLIFGLDNESPDQTLRAMLEFEF